jgi:hypothetical protein
MPFEHHFGHITFTRFAFSELPVNEKPSSKCLEERCGGGGVGRVFSSRWQKTMSLVYHCLSPCVYTRTQTERGTEKSTDTHTRKHIDTQTHIQIHSQTHRGAQRHTHGGTHTEAHNTHKHAQIHSHSHTHTLTDSSQTHGGTQRHTVTCGDLRCPSVPCDMHGML